MKARIKGFIFGMVTGLTLTATLVFASSGLITKQLSYDNIKIELDGKEIVPKDANGNYVEPFTIDGTTYLPVRAVASALELYVDWDSFSNTVLLTTKKPSTTSNSSVTQSNAATMPGCYTGTNLPMYENNIDAKFKYMTEKDEYITYVYDSNGIDYLLYISDLVFKYNWKILEDNETSSGYSYILEKDGQIYGILYDKTLRETIVLIAKE